MRLAILSRYQKTINRGAETFVSELSEALREKNVDVDVLSGADADSLNKILEGKYDVVMPINGGFQALKASLGRVIGGYKLIISGQAGIGRGSIWNLAVMPDIFVALTDHMVRWANQWRLFSKIIKIPNGVDLKKFTPEGDNIKIDLPRPIILSVGALSWYKHHERFIKAVEKMGEGSVLIVGEGEEKEKLQKLGTKLNARFRIDNFSYEDMPKVYRSADLFTLPSWEREAFGIVYVEAMASGLGVVAPNDEARREIVGEGGLLVDVSDPSLYADALRQALKMDWSKKARKQAEKFSWDKIAGCYKNIILEITKK